MKEESTISKINSELIRSFASLDAWFDRTLDDGFAENDEWNTLDVIRHIVSSNFHVLDIFSDGYQYAFKDFDHSNRSEAQKSFDTMRLALREQLFHCMCLLDEMEHSRAVEQHAKEMTVYDKLSAVVNHLQYHLEHLEKADNVSA